MEDLPHGNQKTDPRNAAPVQRENTATVSRDGNAIAPRTLGVIWPIPAPFAGDDAE